MLSQGMVLFERSLSKALTNGDNINSKELNELSVIYFNLVGEMVRFHKKNSA